MTTLNADWALFVSNEKVLRKFLAVQGRIILIYGTGKIFVWQSVMVLCMKINAYSRVLETILILALAIIKNAR